MRGEGMKKKLKVLIELQQAEQEADKIKLKLSRVDPLLAALDTQVSDSERNFQEFRERLDGSQKRYRQHESDIQMNQALIKKSREKLGYVKNNKEYQSILKEIEDLQAKISLVEDEMISMLGQIENMEEEIHVKKSEMAKIKEETESEKQIIQQEAVEYRQHLERLEDRIEQIAAQADPDLLRRYRLLKVQTRGVAIAAVHQAVCQGCNLNIPPQMFNELQRFTTLTFCPHCQRIIYWEESKES